MCKDCDLEGWCHVCKIGIDYFPDYVGVIVMESTARGDRSDAYRLMMNSPLPYGFIPFDNSFEQQAPPYGWNSLSVWKKRFAGYNDDGTLRNVSLDARNNNHE